MVEDLGDTGQEMDVDVVFLEDAIYIATVAIQLGCKPTDCAGFWHLVKHYPDPLSDFHVFWLVIPGRSLPGDNYFHKKKARESSLVAIPLSEASRIAQ